MIHNVWSDRPTFKKLKFKEGLNIVLANRAKNSTTGNKRNAVGKSSLLDVIHFLLGGDIDRISPLSVSDLHEDSWGMTIDLFGEAVFVKRSVGDSGRVFIEGNIKNWPISPDINSETGEVTMEINVWLDLLGRAYFGFAPKSQLQKSFLSFRTSISYFCRRDRGGGYINWRKHFMKQADADYQVNLSYIMSLDYSLPLKFHKIRDDIRNKKSFKKFLKQGTLGLVIGNSSKLRAEERKHKKHADKLEGELQNFKVVDSYESYIKSADSLQRKIEDLTNQNFVDRELLSEIDFAMRSESPPALPDIQRIYQEAGVVLPSVSLKRYDDVKAFHEAIVSNRRLHLTREKTDLEKRMKARDIQIKSLSIERNGALEIINSGGALSHYRKLDTDLTKTKSNLEQITNSLLLLDRIANLDTTIKIAQAEATQSLRDELIERKGQVENAVEIFEDISSKLYDVHATLDILPTDSGPDFVIYDSDISSSGVNKAQIFTFDLMLARLCAAKGSWPGFLIHDSHVFDGVDGRQIGTGLEYANTIMLELGGQYIITMNSDDLDKATAETGIDFKPFVVDSPLDDTPSGGLFGFRFKSPKAASLFSSEEVETELPSTEPIQDEESPG